MADDDEQLDLLVQERERDHIEVLRLLQRIDREETLDRGTVQTLVERLEHNLEERQVAEEELRAQQRQLQEALLAVSAERHRYRELFEFAPVGYFVTDANGVIRDINRTAADLFGQRPELLLGKPLVTQVADAAVREFRGWLNDAATFRRPRSCALHLRGREEVEGPVVLEATVAAVTSEREDATRLRWILTPSMGAFGVPAADGPTGAAGRARAARALRLVVCHPNGVFRQALADFVARVFESEARVVAEVDDVTRCTEAVQQHRADAVLLRIDDEDTAVVCALAQYERLTTIVLADADEETSLRLLAAGADAIVPADAEPAAVLGPIVAAMDGWTTVPPSLRERIVERERTRSSLLDPLDDDEVDLLQRLARGASDAELAAAMHVSVRTVKRRVAQLYRRLHVSTRAEAAGVAGRAGLLDEVP